MGIDTFDCVSPTRAGRHGTALVMAHHWAVEDDVMDSSDDFKSEKSAEASIDTNRKNTPLQDVKSIDSKINAIRADLLSLDKVLYLPVNEFLFNALHMSTGAS